VLLEVSIPRLAAVAVIFLLTSSFLRAEETCGDLTGQADQTRYELRNVSQHRSPIQIDGYLTLRDDPATNVRVYRVHASARNVSKKKISYWSVGFDGNGSSGPSLNLIQSNDYFFTGDVFAPGETVKMTPCPIRLVLRTAKSPAETGDSTALTASARVEFVQFSDGTIWGDRDTAAKVQLDRSETLRSKIESLRKIYSEQGERAFMDALAEPTAFSCLERIKSLCRNENANSSCARKAIQQLLATAAQQHNLEAN